MSLNAMTSLARVMRRRSARAPTCGLPKRVPDHPDWITFWFMICSSSCLMHCFFARRPSRPWTHRRLAAGHRAGIENGHFGLHHLAEALVALGDFRERPVEGADRISRRKNRQGETVALGLELSEPGWAIRNN